MCECVLSRINWKNCRTWRKKYLVVDGNIIDKSLDKIKERIDIKNFDATKMLIKTDDKFSEDVALKNIVRLITCVIRDGDIFLEQALVSQSWSEEVKVV